MSRSGGSVSRVRSECVGGVPGSVEQPERRRTVFDQYVSAGKNGMSSGSERKKVSDEA